jgi:acyl transferase domain-containing protein
MKPAAERLQQRLADIEVRVPAIPVLNNVDVAVETDPVRIKDALVRQAYSPVRWIETVQEIARRGATHVFECGPGKVLAGMTKRIEGSLQGGDRRCGQPRRSSEDDGGGMSQVLQGQVALVTGASRVSGGPSPSSWGASVPPWWVPQRPRAVLPTSRPASRRRASPGGAWPST